MNYLFQVTFNLLKGVVDEKARENNIRVGEKEKVFIANFFKYAFVGIIIEWIKISMEESPEDIINNINIIIVGDFLRALLKFQENGGQ